MGLAWILALVSTTGWAAPAVGATCGLVQPVNARLFQSRVVNDQIEGLQDLSAPIFRAPSATSTPTLRLHFSKHLQKMVGFGGALTESGSINLLRLPAHLRGQALETLFSKRRGAGFDSIRVPIGASDFADGSKGSYTYDDSPGDQPDSGFAHFDMSRDEKSFALIRAARKINPALQVLLSPWSPPAWMKLPTALNGGSLNPQFYPDFARYLVKTVIGMRAQGVPVDSLTIQNEPGYPNPIYPSMGMDDDEQITFIRDFLLPELRASNVQVGIYILDHNWDMYDDVDTILDDPIVRANVRGIAYHCYTGDYTMMQYSNLAHPGVPTLQTECTGVLDEDPEAAFTYFLETYAMGTTGLGSTGAMLWNLILDQDGGPTNNGCTTCSGLITADFSGATPQLTLSPEYFALAQMSKAIQKGSVRVEVDQPASLGVSANAFVNPDGTRSLVVWNPDDNPVAIRVQPSDCAAADLTVQGKAAVTLVWEDGFPGF